MSMKLHLGSGKIKLDGYINVDIEPSHEPDVIGDMLQMDFKDVDVIYLCHSYEHLRFPDDAVKALELFYKWLKVGGILRLAVPDLELAARIVMTTKH
jgi:predicted SAM-dependent methyltransferase